MSEQPVLTLEERLREEYYRIDDMDKDGLAMSIAIGRNTLARKRAQAKRVYRCAACLDRGGFIISSRKYCEKNKIKMAYLNKYKCSCKTGTERYPLKPDLETRMNGENQDEFFNNIFCSDSICSNQIVIVGWCGISGFNFVESFERGGLAINSIRCNKCYSNVEIFEPLLRYCESAFVGRFPDLEIPEMGKGELFRTKQTKQIAPLVDLMKFKARFKKTNRGVDDNG